MTPFEIAERIQQKLTLPFDVDPAEEIVVTASIGIAFSDAGAGSAEFLRDAEIAMYQAEHRTGKRAAKVFDNAMHTGAVKRLQLETDLRRGVELESSAFYQPIVSLVSEQIVGFEALTRWQRPQGMVMPNDFIPPRR